MPATDLIDEICQRVDGFREHGCRVGVGIGQQLENKHCQVAEETSKNTQPSSQAWNWTLGSNTNLMMA